MNNSAYRIFMGVLSKTANSGLQRKLRPWNRPMRTIEDKCVLQTARHNITAKTSRVFQVNLAALQTLNNIIPYLRDSMIPVIPTLVPTVTPNLASKNTNIYSSATQVLEQLRKCVGE